MRAYLFLQLLCAYSFSYSQIKNIPTGTSPFDKMRKEVIVLKIAPAQESHVFPFSTIKVIDKRFDTLAIGYMKIYRNVYENCKLTTDHKLSVDLESLLDNFYPKKIADSSYDLIIVLRKFWFYKGYDADDGEFFKHKKRSTYLLNLGIDCFLFNDSVYTPLLKKDTIVLMDEISKQSEKGALISETLKNIFDSLPLYNSIAHVNKRRLNNDELEEYYNKNFRKPILSDQLKKGVYMSFDEFKKNAPAHTNFEIKKSALVDEIYLINETDTIPSRYAWGYCDGEKVYIKSGPNLFELSRQGLGFSFVGNNKLTHQKQGFTSAYDDTKSPAANLGAGAFAKLLSTDKYKLDLFPMHLDMETGEVY